MPKDRSGRINDEALFLNTGLHNSKAKIKFLKFICLNFVTFTFLNSNSRKKNIMGSISWDESFISEHCLPTSLCQQLLTAPFLSTSEESLSSVPFWYSERSSLWTTLCTLWRPFFICKLKDLNFLTDIYCYLPHLLRTTVITTSVQGSGKGNVSLVPLYLSISILTFCLTRHFFSIWLTHSLSISSPSLSLFSLLISFSVLPSVADSFYIHT